MKNEKWNQQKTIERRWRLISNQLRNPNEIETCVQRAVNAWKEKKRNIIQKKDGKKYDHQNIEILETSKLIYKGRT